MEKAGTSFNGRRRLFPDAYVGALPPVQVDRARTIRSCLYQAPVPMPTGFDVPPLIALLLFKRLFGAVLASIGSCILHFQSICFLVFTRHSFCPVVTDSAFPRLPPSAKLVEPLFRPFFFPSSYIPFGGTETILERIVELELPRLGTLSRSSLRSPVLVPLFFELDPLTVPFSGILAVFPHSLSPSVVVTQQSSGGTSAFPPRWFSTDVYRS